MPPQLRQDSDEEFIRLDWLQDKVFEQTGYRMDAGETAAFARQLEHIYTKTYDIKYAEMKARKFIPVDTSVDPGADFFTYRQWNMVGMAKIIANFADDLPRVDALAKEFPAPIQSLGASYGYSIQDIRRAAMTKVQLDVQRAKATRRAHEQAVDDIAAFGDTKSGLSGFTNAANVPIISPDHAPWSSATALEIIADLNKLCNSIVLATLETEIPDTLLLDTNSFQIINSKPASSTNQSDKTVLKWFLENSPYIKNIDQWTKLNAAGANSGTRIIAYRRSEEVLALVVPQEFEQLPPQPRNLEFLIPTHSRIGGVRVQYPLGIAFMDATGA